MKKACHCKMASVLPRGLVCDRGYLFIRLFTNGSQKPYLEGCGPHNAASQKAAVVKLNQFRTKIFFGTFEPVKEAGTILVDKACDLYLKYAELKDKSQAERVFRYHVKPVWGSFTMDQITPKMANKWRAMQLEMPLDPENPDGPKISFATVNRRQAVVSSLFSTFEEWVKVEREGIPNVKLPAENPFKYVEKPDESHRARSRVPNRAEMQEAKAWCMQNDPELWDAIVRATVTMLRKADLEATNKTGLKDGIQGKTGFKFRIRATFDRPLNLVNWRRRWDALRTALAWDQEGTPTHTVWHDLRHWGPSILGEHGYATKIIQKLTGHATEKMAERYTHLREEKLQEAVNVIQKEMESL